MNLKETLNNARSQGRALAAFNIHNMETLQGVAGAAANLGCPLLLQATPSTIKYAGIPFLVHMAKAAGLEYSIPVALHLDHATDIQVIRNCLEAGFDSVMFDGSRLPLKENITRTREVAQLAAEYGAVVEGELGQVGGEDSTELLTDPKEAMGFVEETGVDLLAVAIGTSHGLYTGPPKLDFMRLEEISQKVKVPLVLHGGSGVPEKDIRRAIFLGVVKVNIATELKIPFTRALMDQMGILAAQGPGTYDPRTYMAQARKAVEEVASQKILMCWNSQKEC